MSITLNPEYQKILLYALGAAILLPLLFRIPHVGRLLQGLFSTAILAFFLFMLFQQAPYEPTLARISERIGLTDQQVAGEEVRIRMSPDGHFWAIVAMNDIEQRMLIDSGATITALSTRTAERAGVDPQSGLVPIILRTANGDVRADPANIDRLRIGSIEARNHKVVVSPALGNVDVIGMNFLSQLQSWRVEGRTLILVPRPAPDAQG